MDRVAASLQRDGVRSGDVISICGASCVEYGAIFLGALRAGVAVRAARAFVRPEALATMLADCGAKILFLDEPIAAALEGQTLPASLRRIPLSMRDWLAPENALAAAGADRSERAVQHHLLLGHDRHAEGHRAIPSHALGARASRARSRATTARP
jgi:long-subunit acyl-CoA synthetase (AMP-forming)